MTEARDAMRTEAKPANRLPPPTRPAILLGYGRFGRTVLERFLTSAALRGALRWAEPGGGASPAERYLRDLAPIHVEDALAISGPEQDLAPEGPKRLEVLRDLLSQIRTVPATSDQEEELTRAADMAVHDLLAPETGQRSSGTLGLDVFVIVQPDGAETLGSLNLLLPRLMEQLANHPFLDRKRRLNFVAILDFDNFWDRSDRGRRLRTVLRSSVERWHRDRTDGRRSFGRIYLVDGRAESGVNREPRRIEEINLFLELLLFEGQRGELQHLFQAHRVEEDPLYTFGVRVLERQAGLLAHRAAAEFGAGWLRYLAGTESDRPEDEPAELRRRLARYRPEELENLFGADELRARLADGLATLEEELVRGLENEEDGWLETVRRRYRETERTLWSELTNEAARRMEEISRDRLAGLDRDLREAIDADLHHDRRPVPLGAVLSEVEASLGSLERRRDGRALRPPTKSARVFERLETLHRRYRRFRDAQLRTGRLHLWWPLFALVLAAGLTPLVGELLRDLPQPSPMASRTLSALWRGAQALAEPLILGPVLFAGAWFVGGFWIQRRFERRLARSERFFTEPVQGRLADRLREAFAPGGAFREPMARKLELLLQDMELAVHSSVRRELSRVRDRLRERRNEMAWLQRQLEEFQGVYGASDALSATGNGSDIRMAAETREDYRQMLVRNPAEAGRFRSAQAERRPFENWHEPWCDAFLHPFHFIEELSSLYVDPFEQELSRPGEGDQQRRWAKTFMEFLDRHGEAPPAFHWHRPDVVPPEQRFCLLPRLWQRLGDVRQMLFDSRIDGEHVLDSQDVGRSYLIRIQGGAAPASLGEEP